MKIQNFNGQFGTIRVAIDNENNPLFCLPDLCKSLGLTNPTMVSSKLDDEDKPKLNLGLPGQNPTFVTESGMYTIILRSDSPVAKPMQKWVTSEVLPSIRKHGAYLTNETIKTLKELRATLNKELADFESQRKIVKTQILNPYNEFRKYINLTQIKQTHQ